ncbi:MAG TPA: hypothetical protein VMT03_14380 [Polyangia bacterium]|nr:hypothetical protein [Polyangia bacterium]
MSSTVGAKSHRWRIPRAPAHEHGRTYQDLRHEIQTGDLLLFRGNRLISGWIEELSDSPYSHCAILARWDERIIAFQADLRGVEILPASTMVCKYQGKVDWWPLKPELRRAGTLDDRLLLDTALTLLGVKYAYWTLIELGLRILAGRTLNPTEAHATPDSLFCSQFVSLVYRTASHEKIRVNPAANDACTSPADFATSGFFEPRYQLFDGSAGEACRDLLKIGPDPQVHVWDGRTRRA